MKRIIQILLILIPLNVFATKQIEDILIYKGDTLKMGTLIGLGDLGDSIFSAYDGSTACARNYIAEFTLIDKKIYLTNIFSCSYPYETINSNLSYIYGDRYVEGKVLMNWFNDTINVYGGKLVNHIGDLFIYEIQLSLFFDDGNLVNETKHNNYTFHRSIYTLEKDSLDEFIYTNIDWSKLPNHYNDTITVYIQMHRFSKNDSFNIRIIRCDKYAELKKELLVVLNKLPDWDEYYYFGKPHRASWAFPVRFSNEIRSKYAR
jgi:hypothetical protein